MPAVPFKAEKPETQNQNKTAELDKAHREEFAKLSPEELKKQQEEFLAAMFEDKPKPEKKADEEKPDKSVPEPAAEKKEDLKPEEQPAETPKEGDEPEPEKPAPGLIDEVEPDHHVAPESITIDDPELKIEAAAPEKPSSEVLVDDDLDEADKQQLAAAAWLAKNDQRFTGRKLDKELKAFWDKEEAFAAKWEKENKGETYDPAAPEHAEFYRKNQPPISESDLSRAATAITEERLVAKAEERTSKRIEELEAKHRVERALPVIERRAKEAVAELVEQILPGTLNGAKVLTREIFDGLAKKDPLATEILNEEAVVLRHQIKALESMVHLGTADFNRRVIAPDGRGFFPASDVSQADIDLEAKILSLPAEKRADGNRKFAPRLAYNKKVSEIMGSPISDDEKATKMAQLDARYWTIQPDDIRDFLVKKSVDRVKRQMARIPKTEKKEESKAATIPTVEKQNGISAKASQAPAVVSSVSDNVDTRQGGKTPSDENAEILRRTMWS